MAITNLTKYVLEHPSDFPPSFVNRLVTHLLLDELEDLQVVLQVIKGLEKSWWAIDDATLATLFRNMPLRLKIEVLDTVAMSSAGAATFREVFTICFKAKPAAPYWRPRLARSLWSHLHRTPHHGTRYVSAMKALIFSGGPEVRALSVRLVPYLPQVSKKDVERVITSTRHSYKNLRMNALNALTELAQNPRRLSSAAMELLGLPAVTTSIATQAKSARSKDVRTCARYAHRALKKRGRA